MNPRKPPVCVATATQRVLAKPALIASLAVLTLLPASAIASRAPTPPEAIAIAKPAGFPAQCLSIQVATVASGWALATLTNVEPCPMGNGIEILRLTAAGWVLRYEGASDPGPCSWIPEVPAAVGIDLGACLALSKRVYIPRGDHVVYKPKLLAYGAHAGLIKLHWRRWGHSVAKARGIMDYSDRSLSFRAPIRARVSRIRPCGVKRSYRRMRVTFDRAADRRRYGALDGGTRFTCP